MHWISRYKAIQRDSNTGGAHDNAVSMIGNNQILREGIHACDTRLIGYAPGYAQIQRDRNTIGLESEFELLAAARSRPSSGDQGLDAPCPSRASASVGRPTGAVSSRRIEAKSHIGWNDP
jgi:hypothetical protein